jgi:hypothetical protein
MPVLFFVLKKDEQSFRQIALTASVIRAVERLISHSAWVPALSAATGSGVSR